MKFVEILINKFINIYIKKIIIKFPFLKKEELKFLWNNINTSTIPILDLQISHTSTPLPNNTSETTTLIPKNTSETTNTLITNNTSETTNTLMTNNTSETTNTLMTNNTSETTNILIPNNTSETTNILIPNNTSENTNETISGSILEGFNEKISDMFNKKNQYKRDNVSLYLTKFINSKKIQNLNLIKNLDFINSSEIDNVINMLQNL